VSRSSRESGNGANDALSRQSREAVLNSSSPSPANTPCKSDRVRLIYNHMVVRPRESEEALNQLFRALADGTRRDILARSLTETPSVSELAARYDMSFAAVQKHVAVLERAGLIQKRANGREQLVSTNHARLRRASELLDYFESIWRQRMAQLDDVLLPKGK
jgi:DNA-binding transcriptional ArsR family regulator